MVYQSRSGVVKEQQKFFYNPSFYAHQRDGSPPPLCG